MSGPNRTMYAVVVAALVVGVGGAAAFAGGIPTSQAEQANYDQTTPDISFIALCSDSSLGETSVTQVFTETNDDTKLWGVEYSATNDIDYIVLKYGTTTKRIEVTELSGSVSVGQGTDVDANGCDAGDDEDKYEREGEPPESTLVLEESD